MYLSHFFLLIFPMVRILVLFAAFFFEDLVTIFISISSVTPLPHPNPRIFISPTDVTYYDIISSFVGSSAPTVLSGISSPSRLFQPLVTTRPNARTSLSPFNRLRDTLSRSTLPFAPYTGILTLRLSPTK